MSEPQDPWTRTPGEGMPPRSPQSPRPQYVRQPVGNPSYSSPASQPQPQPHQQPGYRPTSPPPPPPPASRQPRKKGGAGKVAAVVGIVALAAGAGAGGGVLADRYLDDPEPAATSAQVPTEEPTTVVQADPNAPDWATVAEVASQSVVAIQVVTDSGAGQGSGVVFDASGNIITNNHVVNGARQILVTLGPQSFEAELVGTDPSTDLAVIRMVNPPDGLTAMAIGDSNSLVVGDPVMAIGNPLGLSGTVTTGIVSALDRPVTTRAVGSPDRDTVVTAAIQTNAAINPGNSGGALVNAAGELVGITTAIASLPGPSEGGQGNIGIGFAIGSDQAVHVAEQLIENGVAVHPQVGVTATDVRQVGPMGARIVTVVPGSPADAGGLQEGDVITAINDRSVASTSQLVGLVRAQEVGEPITVTYVRGGVENTVEVTPVAAEQ